MWQNFLQALEPITAGNTPEFTSAEQFTVNSVALDDWANKLKPVIDAIDSDQFTDKLNIFTQEFSAELFPGILEWQGQEPITGSVAVSQALFFTKFNNNSWFSSWFFTDNITIIDLLAQNLNKLNVESLNINNGFIFILAFVLISDKENLCPDMAKKLLIKINSINRSDLPENFQTALQDVSNLLAIKAFKGDKIADIAEDGMLENLHQWLDKDSFYELFAGGVISRYQSYDWRIGEEDYDLEKSKTFHTYSVFARSPRLFRQFLAILRSISTNNTESQTDYVKLFLEENYIIDFALINGGFEFLKIILEHIPDERYVGFLNNREVFWFLANAPRGKLPNNIDQKVGMLLHKITDETTKNNLLNRMYNQSYGARNDVTILTQANLLQQKDFCQNKANFIRVIECCGAKSSIEPVRPAMVKHFTLAGNPPQKELEEGLPDRASDQASKPETNTRWCTMV